MKRLDGYYWVQLHPLYAGTSTPLGMICLYRYIQNRGLWLAPGLADPLTDEHFSTISPLPLESPFPKPYEIWVPDRVV